MPPYAEHLSFVQSATPIIGPISKLGGQPFWLEAPCWPKSRKLDIPMTFIGQIRIDGPLFGNPQPFRMAYLFITEGDDILGIDTYDPDAGENAVIIQPGGHFQGPISRQIIGPTVKVNTLSYNTLGKAKPLDRPPPPVWSIEELEALAEEYRASHPFVPLDPALGAEFLIRTHRVEEDPYIPESSYTADLPAEKLEEIQKSFETWQGTKIGGSPSWVQSEQFPFDDWLLLLQAEEESLPVAVNFGTGIAYCFINKELTTGKLLWQC